MVKIIEQFHGKKAEEEIQENKHCEELRFVLNPQIVRKLSAQNNGHDEQPEKRGACAAEIESLKAKQRQIPHQAL